MRVQGRARASKRASDERGLGPGENSEEGKGLGGWSWGGKQDNDLAQQANV